MKTLLAVTLIVTAIQTEVLWERIRNDVPFMYRPILGGISMLCLWGAVAIIQPKKK